MRSFQPSDHWPDSAKFLANLERWIARSRPRLLASIFGAGLAFAWGLAPSPVAHLPPPGEALAPGDQLRIERRDPQTGVLASCDEVVIDGAGRIIVLGRRLAAAGRTPAELAGQLVSLFAARQPMRPLVNVRAVRPMTVTIAGPADISLPGPRTLASGTRLSRICEVLHPGRRLDVSAVDLVRGGRVRRFDLVMIASGAASEDPVLEDHDTLRFARRDGSAPGYWVLGAVSRPGRRELARGTPVSAALDETGAGPEPTVHLVRGWPERPRIHRLSPIDEAIPDLTLEADDMLLVSEASGGLLGERPTLAALVMALAAEEPIVLAATPAE